MFRVDTHSRAMDVRFNPLAAMASPLHAAPHERLALARRRFFAEGQRPSGLVSEPVLQSWQRCLAAGLRPHGRPDFDPVSTSRTRAAMARSHDVLEAASPEVAQLEALVACTGCRVVLTDDRGIMLRATPAAGGRGAAVLDVGTRVGVELNEALSGSTAPGVSALTGQGCTVLGGEHFFGALEQVHCVAAPIRNREGVVAAILDLSIEGRPFDFDAFAVVRMFAASVENRLVSAQAWDHLVLRFQLAPSLLGTPMEGMAIVDGQGRIVWLNAAGRTLLEDPRRPRASWDAEAVFGLPLAPLEARCHSAVPQPHRLAGGLGLWLVVSAPGRRPRAVAHAAASASLGDVSRQHIEETLKLCRGNIAAAARRLGVSRGLLYRRLRAWRSVGNGLT